MAFTCFLSPRAVYACSGLFLYFVKVDPEYCGAPPFSLNQKKRGRGAIHPAIYKTRDIGIERRSVYLLRTELKLQQILTQNQITSFFALMRCFLTFLAGFLPTHEYKILRVIVCDRMNVVQFA